MNRNELLHILRQHKPILEERFGVTELALFGSFARDQATDILVKFNGPATSKGYFGTLFYIEDLLGRTRWQPISRCVPKSFPSWKETQ